jgi:hypothetical protein
LVNLIKEMSCLLKSSYEFGGVAPGRTQELQSELLAAGIPL